MNEQEMLVWLAGLFEEPPAGITRSSLRENIPMWDSLGTLNLMAAVDEKFGLVLSEADLASFKTVGDVIDFLARHGHLKIP
jgi:acyl carrier protein